MDGAAPTPEGGGRHWVTLPAFQAATGDETVPSEVVNFRDKLGRFSELWSPRVVAELNDYQFKLAKIQGRFVWHDHKDTDEAFIVLAGTMGIEFRDGVVKLSKGELCVVPRGTEHRPFAESECHVLIVEPRGVVNTGEAGGPLQADTDAWV